MVALAEVIKDRTWQQRVHAQREARVKPLAGGLYQALDGDSHPIETLNKYLRKLFRAGKSPKTLKNIAHNCVCWIQNAGGADIDWLNSPDIAFELYWKIKVKNGLKISSATTELSYVHGVFKYAFAEGEIDDFAYPTKIVERSHGGFLRGYVVPDILPPEQTTKILFLPPPSLFRALFGALPPDAILPATTLLKTGARIFELERIEQVWHRRYRSQNGTAVVKIIGKGRRERNVYFTSSLADQLDQAAAMGQLFIRANGKAWTDRTLSEAITIAARSVGATKENSLHISAHTLRHAFASWAYQRMNELSREKKLEIDSLLLLQELLGHASYETTWQTYIHMFRRDGTGDPGDLGIGPIDALLEVMDYATTASAQAPRSWTRD